MNQKTLPLDKIKYDLNSFIFSDGIKYSVHLLLYTDEINKVHSKYALLYSEDFTTNDALIFQRLTSSVGKEFILTQNDKNNEINSFKYLRIKRFF